MRVIIVLLALFAAAPQLAMAGPLTIACGPFGGFRGDVVGRELKQRKDSMSSVLTFSIDIPALTVAITEPGEDRVNGQLLLVTDDIIIILERQFTGAVLYAYHRRENIMLITKHYRSMGTSPAAYLFGGACAR